MRLPTRLPAMRLSGTGLVAAIGGGLAGALLSMLTLTHPPLTVLLSLVAPLPVMLAAIGFGSFAGGLAVLVGSAFAALFDVKVGRLVFTGLQDPSAAGLDVLLFLLAIGMPGWLLGAAARGKPVARITPASRPEERLLGQVAIIAAGFAALSVALALGVAISAQGGLAAFDTMLAAAFEKTWKLVAERRALPTSVDAGEVAKQLVILVPPLLSAAAVFFLLVNLWLAARIAQASDLMSAPWPNIPQHMRVPRFAALMLAVSLGLSVTGGYLGLFSRVVSAALMAVLAIQGLAVVHALTRRRSSRLPLLLLVYLTLFAALPWPLLVWCLVGLLDTAFSFRDRQRPVVVPRT